MARFTWIAKLRTYPFTWCVIRGRWLNVIGYICTPQPNTVQWIPYINIWRVKVTHPFTTINSACHFIPQKQEKQEKQEKPMKKQEKVF